ncbi:tetratricopeptide repeat protein [Clostridium botulinum]|nr:tetratricopeptide repeat protein [Clostridium botulinum]
MDKLEELSKHIENNEFELALNLIFQNENRLNLNAEFLNLKGLLCIKVGEYETAIKCLKKSLEIDNHNADTYYNLAYTCEVMQIYDESVLYYGLAEKYTKDKNLIKEIESIYSDNDTLLKIKKYVKSSSKKTFIILSSCGFTDILQRMHHISKALVKFGHNVNYVCPTMEISIKDKLSEENTFKYIMKNKKIISGVNVFQPFNVIYNTKLLYNTYLRLVQELIDISNEEVIIVAYMPYQINIIKSLKGKYKVIYECVDDHTDLKYAFWGNKKDILWEQELMDSSDAITTTATSLYLQRICIEKRENVYLSRNAVNKSDFIINEEDIIPEDLKNIPKPRIVYTGVVYERYDEKLFYEIIESNPDKSFVVIGPINNGMLSKKYKNLFILGPKKHSELKRYLKYMQIGIVPYIDNANMDIACDSIKQYEYIASKIPVITTYMPESIIDKIYTYIANTKEEFNNAIKQCLSIKIDENKISEFLIENSWLNRAMLICNISDDIITKEQRMDEIKCVGEKITKICETYKVPILKILKAMYLNLEDSKKFEECAKQAYCEDKCEYIEKQYLISLLKNQKINDFIKITSKSNYIAKEIKSELLLNKRNKNFEAIECIQHICINDLKTSLILINKMSNKNKKSLYMAYVSYIMGEASKELNFNKNEQSPLITFLDKKTKIQTNNKKSEHINTFVADIFNEISKEFIEILKLNNIKIDGFCTNTIGELNGIKRISVEQIVEMQKHSKIEIIVPYNYNYVNQIRILSDNGIQQCDVAIVSNKKIILINIDKNLMSKIKEKEYRRTITFNKFNAQDSNVHALLKYIPEKYKNKYNINIIYGEEVWNMENIIKIPLVSTVTVSGFSTFLYNYPKLTYNIEVRHGGVSLKSCGAMDKKDKNSGGNKEIFENADCICATSNLDMTLFSAFYGIPENKYNITGLPRNDTLMLSNSRKNLEKLLEVDLKGKKVIFNMPTFHVFDKLNRVEGSEKLNDSIKIADFNYGKFDEFLGNNDLICISKVHHAEQTSVMCKTKGRLYENLFFISNDNLEEKNLDLYEVLGAGDILITDYSTVYNDFLFMDKPIIFVNTDIDEYRNQRGIALEPYDFWTAGPKVQSQERLQEEIINYQVNPIYYKNKREELIPLFFSTVDTNSVDRVWTMIDSSFKNI